MPPERVREIVAMEDRPVLRNLHITHAYHLLSEDLADVVGQDDASWCTFATWASKAAGFFVREETLKAELRRFLLAKDRLRDRLRELDRVLLGCDPLARICDPDDLGPALETSADVALHVRTGNLVVFEELLVNALVHRDYLVSAPSRLFVFSDRSICRTPPVPFCGRRSTRTTRLPIRWSWR